uniref:Uncharacterized protein n=1 Tax=Cacopsylla melanoneura TaxID=428564 RepID=A0A8D9EWS6_9HEMI
MTLFGHLVNGGIRTLGRHMVLRAAVITGTGRPHGGKGGRVRGSGVQGGTGPGRLRWSILVEDLWVQGDGVGAWCGWERGEEGLVVKQRVEGRGGWRISAPSPGGC